MLNRRLSLAPMMGCTDRHCRYLFRLLAPRTLLYTEMIVAAALLHGDAAYLLRHENDAPCALQLGGSKPDELAAAARLAEQAGYQEVNLNCGCPSDRVQTGGIGACLMADPGLVADCYQAMAEAVQIPVTVKSRIGLDRQDSYEFFARFINAIHATGCRTFLVHARAAWLQGLSPRENREIPPLRYDFVSRAKADFLDASFILNGGIKTQGQATELLAAYDGIMLGRAPYANPWLLAALEAAEFGSEMPERMSVFQQYRDFVAREVAAGTALRHPAKHLLGFFAGLPGARAFRRQLSSSMQKAGAGVEALDAAVAVISPGYCKGES